MSEEKSNWNDIPSLDGLEIDWEFKPTNPEGKRAYARLTGDDLLPLIEGAKDIRVRVVTMSNQFTALLVDVSEGGLRLKAKSPDLKMSQLVKVGLFLGRRKLVSKGRVKYISHENEFILIGIEFVGLSEDMNEYLAGMYSSVKLKYGGSPVNGS
jgi:hypothetical protein